MQVGIYMDLRNPPRWQRPWKGFYETALEQVVEAERLGIAAAWFSEHHFWEDGYLPQPLTFAAAAAARTKRIQLGAGVVLAPLRPAADIAEQAAVVDLISDGRFELGLGAGYVVPEFKTYGVSPKGRFEALEERAIEIRRLWEEGVATPAPLQERMPIWIGGTGLRAARIAGRLGEGLLWPGPASLPEYRKALAGAGHDPDSARMGGLVQMVINDDPEAAWPRISPHLTYQWGSYAYYGGLDTVAPGMALLPDLDPESLRSGESVLLAPKFDVVTPEEAIRRLTEWMGDLPIEHILIWSSIAGMPDDLVARHIELLSTKVTPALRDVGLPSPAPLAGAEA
jgi:alkanesulfonate monooxygenase SsuD/methylene tetrahydromethanopterin reductase-like flavin-dependent oxidoreductase (luciferase family)